MSVIDLSTNTNRWGAPPSALVAIAECAAGTMRYPEPYADSLRLTLAEYHGVHADEITTGCGSDGVLSAVIRASTVAGDCVAIPTPTFPMVAMFARAHGLRVVEVPLTERHEPDVDALLASRPRIAYVCTPNNPTGTPVGRDCIDALARGVELLVVDQAYADFDGGAIASDIDDRILWVRTMSKAWGLAGVRVGYGIGSRHVVDAIERVRGPYAVSAAGVAATVSALCHDRGWMRERAELAVRARERLWAELDARGLDPVPSSANFVFVPMSGAVEVADAMREAGVLVRAFSDALRISVGPWPEMQRALDALDEARRTVACV